MFLCAISIAILWLFCMICVYGVCYKTKKLCEARINFIMDYTRPLIGKTDELILSAEELIRRLEEITYDEEYVLTDGDLDTELKEKEEE